MSYFAVYEDLLVWGHKKEMKLTKANNKFISYTEYSFGGKGMVGRF